jgi:uncharacterized protein YyaL (SSP411 family)
MLQHPDAPPTQTPAPSGTRGSRREPVLWLLLLAFVVFMQWPMLKGWYYRASGTPPPSAVAWRTDFETALAEARQTDRLVLVDVSADWCPPCIAMKHDVWSDAEVGRRVAASYVPLLVDADRDDVVSPRYGVSGIPAVLILDGDGRLVRRASYLPRSGMLRFLAGD